MRSEFELIAESYLAAKQESFTQNSTAEFIRSDASIAVRTALGDLENGLEVKSSPGKGRWSDSPWIAILDPLVTQTPQKGYYVVYLFSSSMDHLVLTLALGVTDIKNNMPVNKAKNHLRHIAEVIRLRMPEHSNPEFGFSSDEIQLGGAGPLNRAMISSDR